MENIIIIESLKNKLDAAIIALKEERNHYAKASNLAAVSRINNAINSLSEPETITPDFKLGQKYLAELEDNGKTILFEVKILNQAQEYIKVTGDYSGWFHKNNLPFKILDIIPEPNQEIPNQTSETAAQIRNRITQEEFERMGKQTRKWFFCKEEQEKRKL